MLNEQEIYNELQKMQKAEVDVKLSMVEANALVEVLRWAANTSNIMKSVNNPELIDEHQQAYLGNIGVTAQVIIAKINKSVRIGNVVNTDPI